MYAVEAVVTAMLQHAGCQMVQWHGSLAV